MENTIESIIQKIKHYVHEFAPMPNADVSQEVILVEAYAKYMAHINGVCYDLCDVILPSISDDEKKEVVLALRNMFNIGQMTK